MKWFNEFRTRLGTWWKTFLIAITQVPGDTVQSAMAGLSVILPALVLLTLLWYVSSTWIVPLFNWLYLHSLKLLLTLLDVSDTFEWWANLLGPLVTPLLLAGLLLVVSVPIGKFVRHTIGMAVVTFIEENTIGRLPIIRDLYQWLDGFIGGILDKDSDQSLIVGIAYLGGAFVKVVVVRKVEGNEKFSAYYHVLLTSTPNIFLGNPLLVPEAEMELLNVNDAAQLSLFMATGGGSSSVEIDRLVGVAIEKLQNRLGSVYFK
jgi:uncharacterized membrane protein